MKELDDQSPEIELTSVEYGLPIPEDTTIQALLYESKSHSGRDKHAIDIAVEIGTKVICPREGIVSHVRDINDQHGPTPEFAKYNNFIEIRHSDGEITRLSHIAKDSSTVQVGEQVTEGQELAKVALVGATTRPHLHWMVAKRVEGDQRYQSLKIRHKKPLEDLLQEKPA